MAWIACHAGITLDIAWANYLQPKAYEFICEETQVLPLKSSFIARDVQAAACIQVIH